MHRPPGVRRSTAWASAIVIALVALVSPAQAEQQASALDLIKSAQRAVGQIAKSAQSDATLNPDKAEAKPFWDAMKELNEALDKTHTGAILKDSTFFSSLATVSALTKQAEVAYTMNNSSNPHVEEGISALSGIVRTLDDNYSKESARLKQGGDLSATERQQLEKLKAQQKELLKKLDDVEKNAANNNDEMKKAIEEIRKNSRRISNSRWGVGDFVGSMIAARMMSDWLWGWHWWWGPWGGWCPGIISINIDIWDVWVDDYIYDWDLLDVYVDVAELELYAIDIDEYELLETTDWLESSDFDFDDGDLAELSSDLDYGWDDVSTDAGEEVMRGMEQNLNQVPYEPDFEVETFDDYGMDDFGGDFGGSDLDFDW